MLRRALRVTSQYGLLLRDPGGRKFGPPGPVAAAGDMAEPMDRFEYGGSWGHTVVA